jgi:ethanolamine utilization protein EutQ
MTTSAPAIGHVSGGATGLPSMEVPGVRLCGGVFELFAGEPLDYEYTYDEMKLVVEGEFHLTDLDSGQRVVARAKDVLFFPQGSRIRFETPDRALGFYTGQRSFAP